MPGSELERIVRYVDLPAQFAAEKHLLTECFERVMTSGALIGGHFVDDFEVAVSTYCGTSECVAVASGTDALELSMRAMGIGTGDEVITPPNSFVASTAAIVAVGAVPVFADVGEDQNIDPNAISAAITPRTTAIMPVHLTGRMADMTAIRAIADKHGLAIVEDAAQAFGSEVDGLRSGAAGAVGCFSAHPLKNLNAAGDAGFITLNDASLADRIRRLRNHGMTDRNTVGEFSTVSRMDALQAEILRVRLSLLDRTIARRRENAELYRKLLTDTPLFIPPCRTGEFNTFHTFVVQLDRRNELQTYLADNGVETAIHYPIPIHLQPAASCLGYKEGDFPTTERQAETILTFPIHQYLERRDIEYICALIGVFCERG